MYNSGDTTYTSEEIMELVAKKPLSYSSLKSLKVSKLDYFVKNVLKLIKKESDALTLGTVIDAITTKNYDTIGFLDDDFDGRKKECKEQLRKIKEAGKVPVKPKLLEKAMNISAPLTALEEWKKCDYQVELKGSFKTDYNDNVESIPFLGYADAIDHENKVIYDVKTYSLGTAKSIREAIYKSIKNYEYSIQAYLYKELAEQMYGEPYEFKFIFLRTDDYLFSSYIEAVDFDQCPDLKHKVKEYIKNGMHKYIELKNTGDLSVNTSDVLEEVSLGVYYLSDID